MQMPAQLAQHGLNIFASARVETLPQDIRVHLPAGSQGTLCLVGHGGREMWRHLSHPLNSELNPIDNFVLEQIARFKPTVLYPHETLIFPLTRLGRHLNVARPSMAGLDIHPEFGLWFGYRAAFLTDQDLPPTAHTPFPSPCDSCAAKPCVTACPSKAVSLAGFQLSNCANYRLSKETTCRNTCHSRIACPVGASHRYDDGQLHYHMLRPAHLKRLAEYK